MDRFKPILYVLYGLGEGCSIYLVLLTLFSIMLKHLFSEQKFSLIFSYYFGFGFPVSLTAYVAGYISGSSREGVVGTVLPAILALLGGLNIYVFGTDNKYKIIVGYCVGIFMILLFFGFERGAYVRELGGPQLYVPAINWSTHN